MSSHEIIGPSLSPQEMRRDYLVPLYVMWTSNVPKDVTQVALQGVLDVVSASGQERSTFVYGSTRFGVEGYSSADWYLEEALRRHPVPKEAGLGPQVLSAQIGALFEEEPWQQTRPHWEVLIINQDLTSRRRGEYLNFVFGSTDSAFPWTVQSIIRVMKLVGDPDLRNEMIRRLLRHEVGHMFGLPGRSFGIEENLGPHCINVCTMKQGLSIEEWADATMEENRRGIHFCQDCLNDLQRMRDRFKPLPNTPQETSPSPYSSS